MLKYLFGFFKGCFFAIGILIMLCALLITNFGTLALTNYTNIL